MTLQAGRRRATEEAARHFGFLGGQHGNLFRNIREGLARQSLEKAHQFAELVFGKGESGHVDLQIGAHAIAIGVLIVERRIFQETKHPFWIDTRTLGEELRGKLLLGILVPGHSHERGLLAGNELVAAHAVIFLDHPPAFLDVAPIIQWAVLIAGGKRIFLAAQEESGEGANLFAGQMQVRHSEFFGFGLVLALVPNVGLSEFVFEEAFLAVPGLSGGTFGKTRAVVRIGDRFAAAALSNFGKQCEIQTLDWFAAFDGELGADAAFFLKAGNFMASGTAEVANPLFAFVFQIRIFHEGGIGIGGRSLFSQRDQIAGNVFGVLRRKPKAGHYGHILDLEFVAVVRAAAVIEVKNKGQALLFVVLGTDVLLFVGAIGTSALAGVVDPAHEVVVVILLTDASEIGRKGSALQLVAFADGVAGEAAARFEQILSVSGVAGLVLGQGIC